MRHKFRRLAGHNGFMFGKHLETIGPHRDRKCRVPVLLVFRVRVGAVTVPMTMGMTVTGVVFRWFARGLERDQRDSANGANESV